MCLGALYWARPDAIWFAATQTDAAAIGFDDAFIYAEIARPVAARQLPTGQLLRDEALAAFSAWRANAQRVDY
jgi:tRNA(Arg) A34 adenosine deaminase TadA